jgi:hypothetical protein
LNPLQKETALLRSVSVLFRVYHSQPLAILQHRVSLFLAYQEYVFAIQKGITLVTDGIAIVKEFIGMFKTKNLTALPRKTFALCRYKLRCIGSTCAIVCAGPL